jgi:hypothetical protein
VLERSVARVLEDPEFDASIPAGYIDDRGLATDPLSEKLVELGKRVAGLDAEAQVDREIARMLAHRPSTLRGGLTDRIGIADIADDTVVQRRSGSVCVTERRGDVLVVLLGDRTLTVPARLQDAIAFIQQTSARDTQTFTPADLAEFMDPQSRLVLVRRLVREGLLKVGD